jgi:hypothetical protein
VGLASLPRSEVANGTRATRYDESGQVRLERKRVDVLLSAEVADFTPRGKTGHIVLLACDSGYAPA